MKISYEQHKANEKLGATRKALGIDAPVSGYLPSQVAPEPPEAPKLPERCRLQPTLALAFLERFPAVGRHYYLLRNYDREYQNGRGIVDRETARELLQGVCSWRRTLMILRQGEGVAWDTSGNHIRLFSPAKVSMAMGSGYLRGNDVIVDTANLTSGIQQARALFYATLYTTRKLKDDQKPSPIKRSSLERITGVKPRTQYTYDRLINANGKPIPRDDDGKPMVGKRTKLATSVQKNVHLGDDWSDIEKRQDAAIKYGYIFPVYDREKHKQVIGRPIPNSYSSKLETVRYGRKKRVNREIRDHLLQNEGTGKDASDPRVTIFHPDENRALTSFNRDSRHDRYWRAGSNTIPTVKRACRLQGVNAWRMVEGVVV